MKTRAPIATMATNSASHFRAGEIIDLQTGKALDFEFLIDRINTKNIVFIGEVHDNPEHHLIQVQIIQALMDRSINITLAAEFFQGNRQEIINRYLRDELTESAFLKEMEWKSSWRFKYHFYRPLIMLAKKCRGGILAINAPHNIVRKVARHGLKNLSKTERNELARDININNTVHREYIRKIYKHHSHGEINNFDFFYEAQCVWEDTMAENIAEHFKRNTGKIVVIAGNGHIINKPGVPDRTMRRFPVSMTTIIPYTLRENLVLKKGLADFIWLTN